MKRGKSETTVKMEIAVECMPTVVGMFEEYEKSFPYIPWKTETERHTAFSLFASGMTRYLLAGAITQANIVAEIVKANNKINHLLPNE